MGVQNKKITLVTGLWDIKRDTLKEGWGRKFEEHYIEKFKELLDVPYNLIIFGEEELRNIIFQKRTDENTQFIVREQEWFQNDFYDKIQKIRTNPDWFNQSGWLKDSTQGSLEMYNPLVMSKMFLLNDAKILSKFDSDFLYWIDAGITNTVHPGYFTHDKVLEKLCKYNTHFNFVAFPYDAVNEIHGFTYPDINKFAGDDVRLVCRGGFFGGNIDLIEEVNSLYYSVLSNTLSQNYMGTEESVFSILLYSRPDMFSYFKIDYDGLLGKFFEDLKNNKESLKVTKKVEIPKFNIDYKKVALYVMTYNSPSQFEKLCESFVQYDRNFIDLPEKYLLNNSIDKSHNKNYRELCEKYGFTEIKKNNIGICGGRQFIAEHFDELDDKEYYFFFEDDMFFYNGDELTCRNGFIRKVNDIYKKSLDIISKEKFDFLKLNFSEFYGDNSRQWAWHNLPDKKRKEYFPNNDKKINDDPKMTPYTNFCNIKSHENLGYVTGEIYYCNWPQIVSKSGNYKMFLETTWKFPYEQTWMSYFFHLVKQQKIKSGVLLSTPTEHDRFDHYSADERKEN